MFGKDLFKKTYSLIDKHRYIIKNTNLEYNFRLSQKYHCNIYLKREDQQYVRSFKTTCIMQLKMSSLCPLQVIDEE